MSKNDEADKSRMVREAQSAVTGRSSGRQTTLLAALKRYLASEQYRRQRRRDDEK